MKLFEKVGVLTLLCTPLAAQDTPALTCGPAVTGTEWSVTNNLCNTVSVNISIENGPSGSCLIAAKSAGCEFNIPNDPSLIGFSITATITAGGSGSCSKTITGDE